MNYLNQFIERIALSREISKRKRDMISLVKNGYEKNNYSEQYGQDRELSDVESRYLRTFTQYLPSTSHVLDLGCGTGVPHDKYLIAKGCNIIGVDIANKHIQEARKNNPAAIYIEADISRFKCRGRFDGIICLFTLFHIPAPLHENVIRWISQKLTKRGVFLLTTMADRNDYEGIWNGSKMAWSSNSIDNYLDILNRYGIEVIKNEIHRDLLDAGKHFWMLGRKIA